MGRGLLVVLSGPSGVGKGTVVKHAMSARGAEARRLRRSVSVTTRARRTDEREGRDYFFRSREEFTRMAVAGELLEWATYLDNDYGTPREWLDRQLEASYDVVLEIEVQGAMQVRECRPEAVLIYMLPASWRALKQRLKRRRSEAEEVQRRRIEVAREEIKFVPNYDYVIVNDRVSRAGRQLLTILEAERLRVGRADVGCLLGDGGE
ncbi:MAG: guanylate kinase [Armatimonadota bacterium]|nr:MAG: guanylate kinase [Armatimonadota bacterium]